MTLCIYYASILSYTTEYDSLPFRIILLSVGVIT